MSDSPIADVRDWTDANKQYLAAELEWLRSRFNEDRESADETQSAAIERAAAAVPGRAAIDLLARAFQLSPFERQLLLLCGGVELDARLATACARAHGDDGRRHVTFSTALAALPGSHWSAVTPLHPLRRWRLIDIDPGSRLVDSPLRIDE